MKKAYEVHVVLTVYADSEVEAEERTLMGEFDKISILEIEDVSVYDEDAEYERQNDK